jgi:hypothetical protein
MGDPDSKKKNLQLAEINIKRLLEGDSPRLIDEWQEFPRFWDAVRFQVDHRPGFGHFILTGSAVPPDTEEISHTGTGRISRMTMRPMTLWESGDSCGSVSLSALLRGEELPEGECRPLELERAAYLVCRGGWPQATEQREEIALMRAYDYYNDVVNFDISRVDKVPRDPNRVMRLMRSYSRLQCTQSNLTAIRLDMKEHDKDLDTDQKIIVALCTDLDAMCEIMGIVLCNHLFTPDGINSYEDAQNTMSRNDKWVAVMKAKVMNSTFDTNQWAAIVLGAIKSVDLTGFFLLRKSVSLLTDSLLKRKTKSVETASLFSEAQSLLTQQTS